MKAKIINIKKLARLYLMKVMQLKWLNRLNPKLNNYSSSASVFPFGSIYINKNINFNEVAYEIDKIIFEKALKEIELKNLIKIKDRVNNESYIISNINTQRLSKEIIKLQKIIDNHKILR